MPNGKTTQPPQNAALAATHGYAPKQKHREDEAYNKLLRSLKLTKWVAITCLILAFIFTFYLVYSFVVLVILQ